MAEMNLEYYGGRDSYSDGDVEERILSDVREFRKDYLSGHPAEPSKDAAGSTAYAQHMQAELAGRVIEDAFLRENAEDAFAYLYHLSPVRANILSWYPFRKDASVLEIGAGPGAVTGVLCSRLLSVTSVELSKRRADINYERNREQDNLTIMVGNLNDMKFPGLFDYVVLNGVFEYAASFTEGADPYGTFLKRCSGFLKKDGVILAAIENRLGLKYFAGAPEDHTGNYMEGLKNYQAGSGVRTFSRGEWEKLAKDQGLKIRRVFYPYPDYKFPNEVFTEKTLSADSFGRNNWNFSERRLELFSESAMARTFQEEGVLGTFMNSFLLELCREDARDGDASSAILYAKMNADRGEGYRIQTIVREREDGVREVVKTPLTERAKLHLARMNQHEKTSKAGSLKLGGKDYEVLCLAGREEDGSLVYPYLTGKNLGREAAEAADRGDADRVTALTDALWSLILCGEKASRDDAAEQEREAFGKVFGPGKIREEGPLVCPANIDLIFDNLILDGEKIRVIDAEWVLDFPVPARFILWRAVNELYSGHPSMEKALPRQKMLDRYQITSGDALVFWKWADHFEKEYVRANGLSRYARPVKEADLKDIHTFAGKVRLTATLYIDRGSGFSEKDSVHCAVSPDEDGNYEASFEIRDPDSVRALRFDPFEGSCGICALSSTEGQLRPVNASSARKKVQAGGNYARICEFLTMDPAYRLAYGTKVPEKVRVKGKIQLQSESWALDRAQHLLGKYQRIFRI